MTEVVPILVTTRSSGDLCVRGERLETALEGDAAILYPTHPLWNEAYGDIDTNDEYVVAENIAE